MGINDIYMHGNVLYALECIVHVFSMGKFHGAPIFLLYFDFKLLFYYYLQLHFSCSIHWINAGKLKLTQNILSIIYIRR